MSTISKSAIVTDAQLEEALKTASFDEIKVLMADAAVRQGLATRDVYDNSILIPVAEKPAATATPQVFKRTENIGGKDFNFEASNELELERMVGQAYKVAEAMQPPSEPVQRDDKGRFVATEAQGPTAEQKADLLLRFQLGQLSVEDYLEQSGEMSAYLEQQGIRGGTEGVKQAVAEQYKQSWEEATAEFLKSSDWPGGSQNLEIIGLKLSQLGLVDAEDKVAALTQAYEAMKKSGTIFQEKPAPVTAPTATDAVTDAVNSARSFEDIRSAVGARATLWGR